MISEIGRNINNFVYMDTVFCLYMYFLNRYFKIQGKRERDFFEINF